MTLSEARTELINRVGWRDDKTLPNFTLSAAASQSDSGYYFQDEHSALTLDNVKEAQPIARITDEDFNAHLVQLKNSAAKKVLDDCFDRDFLDDDFFTNYPSALDTVFTLRMVIDVVEMIMVSARQNDNQRFNIKWIGKLNYDLYRDTVQKFAVRALYKYSMGIATRYGVEVEAVQRRFGNHKPRIRSLTAGDSIEFRNDIP